MFMLNVYYVQLLRTASYLFFVLLFLFEIVPKTLIPEQFLMSSMTWQKVVNCFFFNMGHPQWINIKTFQFHSSICNIKFAKI